MHASKTPMYIKINTFKEVTDDVRERKGVKVRPALTAAGRAGSCEEWRIKDQLFQSVRTELILSCLGLE